MKNFNRPKKATSFLSLLVTLLFIALGTTIWVGNSTADDDEQVRDDRPEKQYLPVIMGGEGTEPDQQVVTVYYGDDAQLDILAQYTDLQESGLNRAERSVSLITTAQQRAELEAAGFRLLIDSAQTEELQLFVDANNTRTIPGYACYRTVEETYTTAASLAATYPNLATWTDIGDSWEKENTAGGYDIMLLKLTNSAIPGPKPDLYAQSAMHAREYATAELNTRFAEYLLSNYGSDPDVTWILDYHEIHLLLQVNPDGRKVAEGGQLYRKNTNENACGGGDYYQNSSTHGGIDLNRNYSFNWGVCNNESCSSSNSCSATYRGTGAASEPEIQTVESYLIANFPDNRLPDKSQPAPADAENIFIDIHSYGELVLWPWGDGSGDSANSDELTTLGRKFAYFNGHTPQRSDQLYPTDGTSTSFAYGELGMAAYTFELGTAFFQNCSTFESSILPTNLEALLYAAKAVRAPYQLPAGPEPVSVNVDSAAVAPGTAVQLSATVDDTRFNNSNGTEQTQTVAAAEYYIDTPPWEAGATAIAMSASDGSFNEGNEIATATIDTTGLSLGQHIIFVRGQDSAGNWGVVSAEFLTITNNPPTTIFSDDFETNQGWTTNPSGSDDATTGQWERANPQGTTSSGVNLQLDATVSGSNSLVTEGTAGSSAGTNDIDNGTTSIRSPDIAIPAGSTNVSLSFWSYLAHLNNANSNDYLRVRVVGNTTQTVLNETGNGANRPGNWAQTTVDISNFAGQTVYLLIDAADESDGSLVEAAVDDVVITALAGTPPTPTNTPLPPTPTNTPLPTDTPTTPQPTNTPLPPTNTPLPPTATNTPLPPTPTNTPLPPTNTPLPPTATNTPLPPTPTNTPPPVSCVTYSSSDTPIGLPNGTASINSAINVSGSGVIADVNVDVDMAHAWVGDLSMSLSHDGTSVTILDRPGVPASQWGCSSDNILATLDDEAASSVEGQCNSGAPAIGGTFQPNNALSAFDGALGNGTWTLNVADAYTSADSGTLNNWSIEICTVIDGTPPPPTNTPLPPTETNTPLPPTNTPIPPTNTPLPPTNTPLPPTNTPLPPTPTNTPLPPTATPPPAACQTFTNSSATALPNGTASISSVLAVSGSGNISDVNFSVDMDHAWVGDLTFTLAHNGTNVTLIDRPGIPGSQWGCSNDDILATLDDDAAAAVEAQCSGGSPTISGTFSPNSPLSGFNGLDANGNWTLTVADAYTSADSGTLNSWSLEICTAP